MAYKYTVLELPVNNQVVTGVLRDFSNLPLEMTYFATEQVFLIMLSGLRVAAIEVESWQNI